jgi:hypothetical protein
MIRPNNRPFSLITLLSATVVVVVGCSVRDANGDERATSIELLPRIVWEGGPNYWDQFPNAADWTDPSFFPIGLWHGSFDTEEQVLWDKQHGINFYTGGLWRDSQFSILESTGMYWVGGPVNSGFDVTSTNWPGQITEDEVDGRFDPAAGHELLQGIESKLRGHGQFLYGNYTQLVVGADLPLSDQERYVNDYADVVSLDMYMYTIPFCDWTDYRGAIYVNKVPRDTCRTASSYGRMTDSLRTRDAADGLLQPIWNFIEVLSGAGGVESFTRYIKPAELKGAAMASLIKEARGLVWFQQSFAGDCQGSQTVRLAQDQGEAFCGKAQVDAMGVVNNLIHDLAPVLNTQSYLWDFGPGTNTMLKVKDGDAYIFAMSDGRAGKRTFTMPHGLAGSVEVFGENRLLTVRDRQFEDDFAAESTYHVYKVAAE